ncbi:hypothetical protein [Roseomonas sp. HF4]|uniref:hypothetical protein n=1 Tax=Roseomonas sp. HF4 TaxID=2562313 RepID=UPI0010BFDD0C|nr:hypothetical protein [Roseomonas sp. HF4]
MRALLPALLLLAPTTAALEPAARVTTDSREYCAELARRFATLPNAEAEPARSLAAEGVRLCDAGHPRTGVAKLRRAIRAARMGQ